MNGTPNSENTFERERERAIFPVDRSGDILAVNRSKCGSYISKLGVSEGTNQLSAG